VLTKLHAARPEVERAAALWTDKMGLALHRTDALHSDCLHVLRDVASLCYSSPPMEGVVVVAPAATSGTAGHSVQPLLAAGAADSGRSCCCGRV
jgi:hypothetical protein